MGYYTNYTCWIDDPKALDNHTIKKIEEEYKKMSLSDFSYDGMGGFYAYDKWYDHEEDMELLSARIPNVLFHLEGDGEESDDFWQEHFLNGKSQLCHGTVTYEPYDPDLLEYGIDPQDVNEDRCYSYE